LGKPSAAATPQRPDSNSDNIVRLVEAARAGDRSAFAEIFAVYRRTVRGIVLSRVPYAEVDDLVQDVFLQAMQRLPSLRDAACLSQVGWRPSRAIVRRTACDRRRGRRR
jgi:DNA-directed RNA polymerase specialized sigma24 family protein